MNSAMEMVREAVIRAWKGLCILRATNLAEKFKEI
jgi:hypothetical protein